MKKGFICEKCKEGFSLNEMTEITTISYITFLKKIKKSYVKICPYCGNAIKCQGEETKEIYLRGAKWRVIGSITQGAGIVICGCGVFSTSIVLLLFGLGIFIGGMTLLQTAVR